MVPYSRKMQRGTVVIKEAFSTMLRNVDFILWAKGILGRAWKKAKIKPVNIPGEI